MALWTPALLGNAVWLKSSDADSITLDGSNIDQINDKGPNGFNATSTGTARPVIVTAELNGQDVIRFDGSDDNLTLGTQLGKPANYTIYAVAKFTKALSGNQGLYGSINSGGSSATTWGTAFNRGTRAGQHEWSYGDGTAWRLGYSSSASFVINEWNLYGLVHANGTQNESVYKNGLVIANTGLSGTAMAVAGTAEAWKLGQWGDYASTFFGGDFAEIVIDLEEPDENTRQKIEGYFAHEHGLTARLDSGHPYKSIAPRASAYFGTVRDKTGTLAVGRGVRVIREADQVCVAYDTTVAGEYEILVDAFGGTVTTASASVITDSGQAWTTDEWATHYGVRMTSGTQAGEWRRIASNTATALTLESALPGTTAINDTFEIAALHTLVFSGESDRNALVYSGVMPDEYTSGA
jgi:hypothetical protein